MEFMKLRRLLLSGAIMMAVLASFGLKAKSRPSQLADFTNNGTCYSGGTLNQTGCYTGAPGPQCTATLGILTGPAYQYSAGCVTSLHLLH
jgi:hypothetical protein